MFTAQTLYFCRYDGIASAWLFYSARCSFADAWKFSATAQSLVNGVFLPKFSERYVAHFGSCFFADRNHFVVQGEKRFNYQLAVDFVTQKGIALGDTAQKVVRLKNNASDAFLQIEQTIDLNDVLQRMPLCSAIVVTGQKAAETLCSIAQTDVPSVGQSVPFYFSDRTIRIYRMPSSSRAYPMPLERKAEFYAAMFAEVGL